MISIRQLAITALLATSATMANAASGTGTTTRYWDCCKPSCAWDDLDQLGIESAVTSCDINDSPLSDTTAQSGCESGGAAYMCSDQSPWAVSDDLAYGFAAVSASSPACCQCYQLTFTSTSISGKKMIVQATNTGSDVGSTQFDIAMPGGGFGIFDGCTNEWGATADVWGAQYGGSSTNTCPQFPPELQPGCNFRWDDFFQGADNPSVEWEEVACPSAITAKSGCVRKGDTPTGSTSAAASSSKAGSSTSVPSMAAASSSESTPESPATSIPSEETPASSQVAVSSPSVSGASADMTTDSGSPKATTFAVQTSTASSELVSTLESSVASSGPNPSAQPVGKPEPVDAEDEDTCEP